MLYVIFFFIFGGIAVFFAKQNTFPIIVKFFTMEVDTSLDVVMVVAFIAGGLLTAIFASIQQVKMAGKARTNRKQVRKLEDEVQSLQDNISELNAEISRLQEEAAIAIETEYEE